MHENAIRLQGLVLELKRVLVVHRWRAFPQEDVGVAGVEGHWHRLLGLLLLVVEWLEVGGWFLVLAFCKVFSRVFSGGV